MLSWSQDEKKKKGKEEGERERESEGGGILWESGFECQPPRGQFIVTRRLLPGLRLQIHAKLSLRNSQILNPGMSPIYDRISKFLFLIFSLLASIWSGNCRWIVQRSTKFRIFTKRVQINGFHRRFPPHFLHNLYSLHSGTLSQSCSPLLVHSTTKR